MALHLTDIARFLERGYSVGFHSDGSVASLTAPGEQPPAVIYQACTDAPPKKAASKPEPKTETAGVTEGKDSKRIPTTPQSKRIATIFHRKLTTPWTDKEIKAYKALGTIPEDDLVAVEQFYAENWPPQREMNCLRHDLLTFLNNFPGEVGKANAAKLAKPVPANRPFQQRLPTGL